MKSSFARTFANGGDLSPWEKDAHFTSVAPGCLRVRAPHAADKLLLSCGIHGDETAPIEMLDRLIEDIRRDALIPLLDVMFVVGNPHAIHAGKRFIDHDMNRLFDGAWQLQPRFPEAQRAHELEAVIRTFFDGSPAHAWHLDLHTTIRPSHIECFAIANAATKEELPADLHALLHAAGLGALVFNPHSRTTCSSFSSRIRGVASLTIELGQGKRFGENDATATFAMEAVLRALIAGHSLPAPTMDEPACFAVSRELIRTPGTFVFHLPETMENFTPLADGQPLATTVDGTFTARAGERILFPNPNVAPGLRAGLLLQPLVP